MGKSFIGIIGVVLFGKKQYRIATYLGAKINRIENNFFEIIQGDYKISARLLSNNSQPLYAPKNGNMDRIIHENIMCKASYYFSYKNEVIFRFTSNMASFEFEF